MAKTDQRCGLACCSKRTERSTTTPNKTLCPTGRNHGQHGPFSAVSPVQETLGSPGGNVIAGCALGECQIYAGGVLALTRYVIPSNYH